ENFGGGLNRRRVENPLRYDLHPIEGFAIAAQRELTVGAVGGVVVVVAQDLGVGDGLEIERRDQFVQCRNAAMVAKWVLLRTEQWGTREKAGHRPNCVAAVQAVLPGAVVLWHPASHCGSSLLRRSAGCQGRRSPMRTVDTAPICALVRILLPAFAYSTSLP